MSETLRDLVVSLSLQTDNFTRNIRSVQKQIAEAESQFRLAAAGVEGFEQSAEGLTAQLSTLERRLTLQQQAVTQYERALTAANDKLQECFARQGDYAQRLTDARAAQEALKAQVAAAAQQVRTFRRRWATATPPPSPRGPIWTRSRPSTAPPCRRSKSLPGRTRRSKRARKTPPTR